MQTVPKELIYLYCVTKARPGRSSFEDVKVKIYPIYFQGTYAVVSKVSSDEFSEDNLKKKLADMKWVEKRVWQHEKVIEDIMCDTAVLPFKFGTVFETEKNVEKLLKEHNAEFKRIIADLEGTEEWGLKIYCGLKKFRDAVDKQDENIKEMEEEIASAGKGKAYFLKKEKEELIKNIINKEISEYTHDSFERLKRVSLEAKINKVLPKEVTERSDEMVLNAAFLIDKKRISEFKDVLEYLKTKYSGKGLTLDFTGPWPPYNFCSLSKEKAQSGSAN